MVSTYIMQINMAGTILYGTIMKKNPCCRNELYLSWSTRFWVYYLHITWMLLSFDKEYVYTVQIPYACKYLKAVIFYSALRNGGRYKWLWLTCILQGLTTEMVSYFLPDIDNFWHAQGMVMFAGQRLPLYIMVLCKSRFQIPFYLVRYTMVELCLSGC